MNASVRSGRHRQRPPDVPPPVDRRLERWPLIYCELCGTVAIAVLPSTQFCIDCGLYVCAGCWREADSRCSICVLSAKRPSMRQRVRTLRRVDRRLREVIAELDEPDDGMELGWDRPALATIKIEAALQARDVAVAHLPIARQRRRVTALLRRIERHSAAAPAAVERELARRSTLRLAAATPSRGPIARLAPVLRLPRAPEDRRIWIAAGAAATVLTVLVGGSLIGTTLRQRDIAEGVLSGSPQEGAAPSIDSAGGAAPPAASTPSPAGDSVALFDFDGRQMGSGLGPGWRDAGGGEVNLAAFPTGVDRSARLVADGTTPTKACRTLDAGARAVEIDVFLDPPVPVAGRVELTDAADGPVIAIELSESRTLVSTAADVVEAAGVQLATWVHVEVRWDDGGMAWEVTQEANASGPPVHGRSEARTTEGFTEICLGVEAAEGGAAHYDNLAIQWTSSEGG
jgi:hypothetical protein